MLGSPSPPRRFATPLAWRSRVALIVAVGVGLRALYVLRVLHGVPPGLDAIWYTLQGTSIRQGTGFSVPTSLFTDHPVPTAGFPPVYPAYQAAWQWVFGAGPTSVRLAGLVPAACTIALTAVLARRFLADRAALLAAAVVAVDVSLLAVDGSSMSENVAVPIVLATVLAAHVAVVDGLRARRVLVLGLLGGLAVLARQDLLFLVALTGAAVVAWSPVAARPSLGRRLGAAAALVVLAAVVVVPWMVRNDRALGSFTVATLSPNSSLAGSNCDRSYRGAGIGGWDYACVAAVPVPADATEVQLAAAQQAQARGYARAHLRRAPLVVLARQARVWSLWDPRDLARRDTDESRRYGWQLVARPFDVVLLGVGATGLAVLVRRRGRTALLLLGPLISVAISATLSHGNPRFNAIAHPVLAIGVASVAVEVVRRATAARGPATGAAAPRSG